MAQKTMDQRSAAAKQIDQLLGTTAEADDSAVIDLLLDWMLASAQWCKGLSTEQANLQARVAALEAKVAAAIASDKAAR